jgi:hypothetical protein
MDWSFYLPSMRERNCFLEASRFSDCSSSRSESYWSMVLMMYLLCYFFL